MAAVFQENGRKIDKDTTWKLFNLVDKSESLLELVENVQTLAYANIFEALLHHLNFWLQGEAALWQAFAQKQVLSLEGGGLALIVLYVHIGRLSTPVFQISLGKKIRWQMPWKLLSVEGSHT